MCTLVILRRPSHRWPLLAAGNRDEMGGRPWLAPARHWGDRREVVAGLDRLAGGSWFGINDYGVAAVVMNREGSLGPAPGRRSRGELVLEALDHAGARDAARALADLDPCAYRGFNLLVGDAVAAYWLAHRDDGSRIAVTEVTAGLHMLTARELDDTTDPRIRHYLPRFRAAKVPNPEKSDWHAWQTLLASRIYPAEAGPEAAMNVHRADGFGTRCSHCVALPRDPGEQPPQFLFAAGPPDVRPFRRIELRPASYTVR